MDSFSFLRWGRTLDPRYYQIATLSGLLVYGVGWLDVEVEPSHVAVIVVVALLVQWLCTRWRKLPQFDPKSALISALGLSLLLRTNHLELAAVAAAITIASKFVLRIDGKHVFNPTNFALVVMLVVSDGVWVSPGQWGSAALVTLFALSMGTVVVRRAERSDVTIAFLLFYSALLFTRALYLGDPLAIPIHQLQNGAFLIFAFFMISDPKTTPDTRVGRIVFAFVVAVGALYVQFVLYRTNGLLWSLVVCSVLVPFINRIWRGEQYKWGQHSAAPLPLPYRTVAAMLIAAVVFVPPSLTGFCGFYVAKADASLYNKASQVVLARNGDHTVLTMANDYSGDLKEFAVVVPVPTVLQEKDIRVVEKKYIDRIDAFSAPRLVEYFDANPCDVPLYRQYEGNLANPLMPAAASGFEARSRRSAPLGVTIEARYAIGEYDILILSAEQSDGLETWLLQNGYKIPQGASAVLGSYIKQNLKFFVAKVNLTRKEESGFAYLRPIQVAYTSPKFILPIRLGTVNAHGTQDLLVYTLTTKGRVETTNYRTVRLPTGSNIPVFVKDEFAQFYRAMFNRQVQKEGMTTVFLEHAWNAKWCDPCASTPLDAQEVQQLGGVSGRDVFVTRLHVRYDAQHFPEDLVLQETGDQNPYQSRFVLTHAWHGNENCAAARKYRTELQRRLEGEAQTLASLTGWSETGIRNKMDIPSAVKRGEWWEWGGK